MMNAIVAKPRVRVPAGGIAFPAGLPSRPAPAAAFMKGEMSPTFAGWHPSLREANEDVRSAWRNGTARAVDAIQNSGWLSGAVDQSCASVAGTGLTLSSKPDMGFLGWTKAATSEWARKLERRFELWANCAGACDAGAKYTLGQIGRQAYRQYLGTGEIVATLPYFSHPGSMFKSKVKLVPSWRLSDRMEPQNNLFQGVRLNAVGAPKSYIFRQSISGTVFQGSPFGGYETEIAARDAYGRPFVAHILDGEADQYRGITPFISILKVTRQFDQLSDATLTAAVIQAIFAAVFKSAAKPEEVLAAMQTDSEQKHQFTNLLTEKGTWYDKADISLGTNGKIAHLFPGDELEFLRSEHPNSTYEAFTKVLLRECSRPLAMSYEDFSGDYSGATYSSTRMATAMNWPRVLNLRNNVVGRFHQTAFENFLEEDIENGNTELPGGVEVYLANKDSIARADWRGPPKPQADDLKASKAHQVWRQLGVMSDEMICAELGQDVDDVYEQLAREAARRKELGLPDANAPNDPVGDALATQDEGQSSDNKKPGARNGR